MSWFDEREFDRVDWSLIVGIAVSGIVLVLSIFPGPLCWVLGVLSWALGVIDVRQWTWKIWLAVGAAVLLILVVVRTRMEA